MKEIRDVQLLSGLWDYRIGEGAFEKKVIPYSDAPVGVSECRLQFDAAYNRRERRVFLVFDGITYEADVTFNGKSLGKMLPYCEYRFEVTELLLDRENCLSVIIRDTEIVFGAGEGWENYSGITRDVWLEYTASTWIEDVFWHTDVTEALDAADCVAEIKLDGEAAQLQCVVSLLDPNGHTVHREAAAFDGDKAVIRWTQAAPRLWSPDAPVLYTLTVELQQDKAVLDACSSRVGFKRFETKGRRFYLNGEPFFLLGVCRHEIWGESGHMLTDEQIEADLAMIKELGCNYVRLVHYPHRKKTLELADRLGLLISEEPGLWWSDMSDQSIVDASLEVLRRTVLRDRSHACIAFWLSFNECIFTPEYLKAAADTCRLYDPYHMVSGANCMDIPMTKEHFPACGLDFYTMHPYCPDESRITRSAKELCEMPLVFTEWGGYYVYNNPFMMKIFVREIVRLWQAGELTGAAFWCWSEMYEINRAAPACFDGLQCEGLVNRFREPTLAFQAFKEEFAKLNEPQLPQQAFTASEFDVPEGEYQTLPLASFVTEPWQAEAYARMLQASAKHIPRFYYACRGVRSMKYGPVLLKEVSSLGKLPVDLTSRPVVIEEGASFEINVNADAEMLYLVGLTGMPKGFPIGGEYGEPVGKLELRYADGTVDTVALRNGYEVTTATAWYGPSRINPRAAHAKRAIHFVNDMDREHYVANLLTVPTKQSRIEALTVRTEGEGYCLLLYGITARNR